MKPSTIHIRQAESRDLPAILELVKELAVYERAPHEVTATIKTYESAFSEGLFQALIAEHDNDTIGVALYYPTFSTWKGKMMYLEDFVVRSDMRGKGVGQVLFDRFIQEARAANAVLCKWQVLDWNNLAIQFYRRYPVELDDEWMNVKYFLNS